MVLFHCTGDSSADESILPLGDSRAALVSPHFPDRLHEFIWRNWNAVEPAKLAGILGASVPEITALAESMGLPPNAISTAILTRMCPIVTASGVTPADPHDNVA